ncbi:MAG: hypothetical protein GX318_06055 [Clostridia bacterium]|nr:hypothetical protein [Clostridia bacterium]
MEAAKYTFAIIPFKFKKGLKSLGREAQESKMWRLAHSDYSRIYKHISVSVNSEDSEQCILECAADISPERSAQLGLYMSDKVKYRLTGRTEARNIVSARDGEGLFGGFKKTG